MKLTSFKDFKRLIFSILISVLIILFCYGILQMVAAYESQTDDWETVNGKMEEVIQQPAKENETEADVNKETKEVSTSETEFHLLINLNKADVYELEKLPGIGPAKAKAIIDYRVINGQFKTIKEVTKVKGIGKITFENMEELITVDD